MMCTHVVVAAKNISHRNNILDYLRSWHIQEGLLHLDMCFACFLQRKRATILLFFVKIRTVDEPGCKLETEGSDCEQLDRSLGLSPVTFGIYYYSVIIKCI